MASLKDRGEHKNFMLAFLAKERKGESKKKCRGMVGEASCDIWERHPFHQRPVEVVVNCTSIFSLKNGTGYAAGSSREGSEADGDLLMSILPRGEGVHLMKGLQEGEKRKGKNNRCLDTSELPVTEASGGMPRKMGEGGGRKAYDEKSRLLVGSL